MIDVGRLSKRLTIEAPVESDDGQGGIARSFQTLATVWALIEDIGSSERVNADAAQAAQRTRILIREGVTLTRGHRLTAEGCRYRVIAHRSRDRGRFIEIDAERIET